MHGAQQVGRENEAALEHRDDKQLLRRRCLDLIGERNVARRYRVGIEQNADRGVAGLRQGRIPYGVPAPISRRLKKRTITSRPSGGGEPSRERNGNSSPGVSVVRVGSAVQ